MFLMNSNAINNLISTKQTLKLFKKNYEYENKLMNDEISKAMFG